ncbi:hypothetical protein SPB21_03960 [Leptothoe sp. ISB3NOV94-8A]
MTDLTIDKRDGLFLRICCTDNDAMIDIAVSDAGNIVFDVHGIDGIKRIKLSPADSVSFAQAFTCYTAE